MAAALLSQHGTNIGVVQEGMMTIARPITLTDKPEAGALTVPRGEIEFRDIRFGYGRENGLIDGLSLTIQPTPLLSAGDASPLPDGKSLRLGVCVASHEQERSTNAHPKANAHAQNAWVMGTVQGIHDGKFFHFLSDMP